MVICVGVGLDVMRLGNLCFLASGLCRMSNVGGY